MNIASSPISCSAALSLALHGALAVLLLTRPDVMPATGKAIAIELVSSSYNSNHERTERAASKTKASSAHPQASARPVSNKTTMTANSSTRQSSFVEQVSEDVPLYDSASVNHDSADSTLTTSTNSSAHKSSIIELLHSRISEHKQYPYLAIRQRREGVARVEFVLHPDGAINDARLIQSSRTRMLDKAALDAVKRIEPFRLAKDYLEKPEAFQVDVVFNVM
jgi:protein TonB